MISTPAYSFVGGGTTNLKLEYYETNSITFYITDGLLYK